MNMLRRKCTMRHPDNGNCLPIGGFCTAVNDEICEGLHHAFNSGYVQHMLVNYAEKETSKWILHKDGSATCNNCHRTQLNVWDYDSWQRYCGCCGAKMEDAISGT